MSAGETARKHYESARLELIERIKLRDHSLLVYLGVVGTILSAALAMPAKLEILLSIPYIALGVAVIISQHNEVIGSLGDFCARELEPFLRNLQPPEDAPQWDNSAALHDYSMQAIKLRSWGHFLLIIVPPVAGLSVNWRHGFYSPFPNGILWWFGIVCMVLAVWIIFSAHLRRKNIYEKYRWRSRPDNA